MGLTVPAMLVISHWTNHPIVLGVEHAEMVLLLLTITLCVVTFSSGHTNVLQGVVHLLAVPDFSVFAGAGVKRGHDPAIEEFATAEVIHPKTVFAPFRVPTCRPPYLHHR